MPYNSNNSFGAQPSNNLWVGNNYSAGPYRSGGYDNINQNVG